MTDNVREGVMAKVGKVREAIEIIGEPLGSRFAGSAIILGLIWRSLLQIAHADEHLRAEAPTADRIGVGLSS